MRFLNETNMERQLHDAGVKDVFKVRHGMELIYFALIACEAHQLDDIHPALIEIANTHAVDVGFRKLDLSNEKLWRNVDL